MRREAELVVQHLDGRPTDLEADDLPCRAAALFFSERRTADEWTFVELHEPAEPHFERRVLLRFDQRLFAAVEVDVDEQQSRFDASDVEREHAGWVNVEGLSCFHERVPDLDRAVPRHPDLEAEIACVARA